MRALSFAFSVSLWLAMLASPAEAAALIAAIGAFFTSGTIVAQVVGRILVSVAASALMQALAPKPRPGSGPKSPRMAARTPAPSC
ncbi:MAG: hypothetical protein ACLGIE_09415 [Alphaproteobacteria bacterium]